MTSNLTVNLGLRYQIHTPWTEAQGRQINYGIYSGGALLPGGQPFAWLHHIPGFAARTRPQ